MPDKERSEDLNPRNQDIEEKVKQMLDPSIPDEPVVPTTPSADSKTSKISIVDNSSDGTSPQQPTAPELPSDGTIQKERKVIVPVSHDDDPAEALPEKKIDVADHGATPEELEQELNKAIADLDTANDKTPDTPAPEAAEAGDEPATEDSDPEDDLDDISDKELQEALDDAGEDSEADDEAPEPEDEQIAEDTAEPSASDTARESSITKKTTQKKASETTAKEKSGKSKDDTSSDDIDDPALDKAVKDIVAKEKDDIPAAPITKPVKKPAPEKKKKVRRQLTKKAFLWGIFLVLLAALAFLTAAPDYRYKLLNAFGVRASSSVTVTDVTTGQPLPNATVRLGDTTATTNEDGYAELGNLLLGDATLTIEKVAFAKVEEPYTVGWGSNPLGERSLTPTGIQFTITVKDYLSGGSVASAVASRDDSSATADDNGVIKLTIPNTIENQVTITLSADGYKTLEIKTPTAQTDLGEQILVPAQKQTYIAPDYTIYTSYVDGSERSVLLEPSGFEEPDLVLIPQPGSSRTAYISTRANNRNDQGNLTYNLLMLDSTDGTTKNIALADQFIPHGWIGGYFMFTAVTSGDDSAGKSKLQAYNVATGAVETLANSNYFNDVHIAAGRIYYAPASVVPGGTDAKLFSSQPDGSDQRTLFDDEAWKLFRNSYEQFAVSAQDEWYQYNIATKTLAPLEDNADNRRQLNYVDSPDGSRAAVISADGKLQLYQPDNRTSDDLVDDQIVQYPIYWFNDDTVVYRTEVDGQLYAIAVSVSSGRRVELSPVAETADNDGWYFY